MKPSLPQGTRDFNATVVRKRNYILSTIRSVFELYGFEPLETPAMENLDTLMGKYGEEGDKLIFKILNNGLDNPSKEASIREGFDKVLKGSSSKSITERALRYDLTIPFARYVAMNHNLLSLPFRRYQVQPVWRADRPQKGRYREFYQCDADVVGSRSLYNEVEFVSIYQAVFEKLNLKGSQLRINSRKILSALASLSGGQEKMMDITIAIDKLDKIGLEKVQDELVQRGINNNQIKTITEFLNIQGNNREKLSSLEALVGKVEEGKQGIEDLKFILDNADSPFLQIDPTLARGLNYYTGVIFEARAPEEVKIGSIGGGGRYDDLTGLFGVPNIPGIGISFGVDRIYDVLEELDLFPSELEKGVSILFFNLGKEESAKAFELLQSLRNEGVSGVLYHEESKFDKQFKYAEKKSIPFVAILGSKELQSNTVIIKNLQSGEQVPVAFSELASYLNSVIIP